MRAIRSFALVLFLSVTLSTANSAQTYTGPPAQATSTQFGRHWSYPGEIDDHLRQTHGKTTTGMTREEMLNLHDAIHEGRSPGIVSKAAPVKNRRDTRRRFKGFKFS